MNVGSLFSGVGLLDYGLHLAGFEHAWFCERDEFRRGILARRWPGAPVHDDVRTLTGAELAPVGLLAGGFPCKGVSDAGKREGFGHPETALWREMLRLVCELRPHYVLVENVAALLTRHDGALFAEVLAGLAACGYDAEWDCFPAAAFGAPHGRDRVFVTAVADTASTGWREAGALAAGGELAGRDTVGGGAGDAADALHDGREERPQRDERQAGGLAAPLGPGADGRSVAVEWGEYEPAVCRWEAILGWASPQPLIRRVDDGRTRRVERSRLAALGDGVLVQAGWLAGRRIVEYEARRVKAAA